MSVVAFDTLKFVKRLRDAGFTEPQAEAVTLAVQEAASLDLSALATRSEIKETEQHFDSKIKETEIRLDAKITETHTKIRETELRLEARIVETKVEILKWLVGLIGFQTIAVLGGIAALIKLIH